MPRGDKLEKRAKEMRMIGYASNGYRLWDPKADLILISRDVRFDENDFVYEKNIKEQNDQRITKQNDDEDDEIEQNCNKQTTNEEEQPIEQDTSDEVRREAQEAPQRPQRDRRPPPRFEDYYTAEEEMYDANIAFSLIADSDPRSYKEAVDKGEEWKKAINEEIKSLEELNTWKEAELPRGKKAIDTKWIFKTKQDGRKKARLVAKEGFEQSKYDFCLYYKANVWLLIWVDDILITGKTTEIKKTIEKLKEEFKIRDLGEVREYLGMEIKREHDKLKISQTKLIEKVLEKFGMTDCKGTQTPMEQGTLIKEEETVIDVPYRELIGCLIYISTVSRPDITFATSYLSRFLDKPTNTTWTSAKRILRYLKLTSHKCLTYTKTQDKQVLCYTDADWASNVDRKSRPIHKINNLKFICRPTFQVLPHDGFPQRLCAVCGVLLAKSAAFRDRCRRARDCLRKQHHNKITMDYIETIDRLSHHLVFTLALSQVEVNDTRTYPLEVRDEPSIVVKDTISKHEVDPLGLDTEEHSNSPIDNDQELVDDIHSHSPIDSDQELLNDIDSHSPVDSDQELVNDIHSHLPIDDDQKLVDDIHSHSPIDNDLELLYDINSHSPLDNDQGLFDDILSHSPIDNDQELLNDKSDEVEEISKQIKIVRIPTDKVEVQKKPTRKRIMQLINKKKELKKRRIRGPSPTNECRPNFNVAELEKELNVDIEILNKEQQLADWRQFSASKKRPAAFSCQECGKGFDQLTSYQNHLLRHGPSAGRFPCAVCSVRFKGRSKLNGHELRHALRFICRECKFVSRDKTQAKLHFSAHEGHKFQCKHCEKSFVKKREGKRGKRREWREKREREGEQRGVERKRRREREWKSEKREGKRENREGKIDKRHWEEKIEGNREKREEGESEKASHHFIDRCTLRSKRSSYLSHVRLVHVAQNVTCVECGETFVSRLGLKIHYTTMHQAQKAASKCACASCGAPFDNAEALQAHARAGCDPAKSEESRPTSQESLARWLDQGPDTEGGTSGHGTHRPEVPHSAALTTGSLGPAPLPAAN
ncbi:hypothetical protein MSG28_016126 [Choristoneura fumiferana]|uniref:Uncharacterized protein n=1 Tax=Choristoneura fumiferana TaxID=7141 RepID=A0ACC0K5A5_CHOFU|nr:hypothetical protein MSG28_016126 [Choristoneura fumiferana]